MNEKKKLKGENSLQLEWKFTHDSIDWKALSHLYQVAPLGDKKPDDLKNAFSNSMFKCFVFSSGTLVGVGRALADGIDCSYICDIAVIPDYQGTGLGKQIIEKLILLSKGHKKIILYSVPGKESFYKRFGFKRMSTAMAIFNDQEQALEMGLVNNS